MKITVVYSPVTRQVHEWTVDLNEGATVAQALAASGLQAAFPLADVGSATVGVWGRRTRASHRLNDGDRVEIYRPLIADPKEVRKRRAAEGKRMGKGGGDLEPKAG